MAGKLQWWIFCQHLGFFAEDDLEQVTYRHNARTGDFCWFINYESHTRTDQRHYLKETNARCGIGFDGSYACIYWYLNVPPMWGSCQQQLGVSPFWGILHFIRNMALVTLTSLVCIALLYPFHFWGLPTKKCHKNLQEIQRPNGPSPLVGLGALYADYPISRRLRRSSYHPTTFYKFQTFLKK